MGRSAMPDNGQPAVELVEPTAKNGVITAVGFILGFSLNFIADWVFNWPLPAGQTGWARMDILPAILLVAGVGCLTTALYMMLLPYRLPIDRLPSRVRTAIAGVILIFLGVFVAILNNAPEVARLR